MQFYLTCFLLFTPLIVRGADVIAVPQANASTGNSSLAVPFNIGDIDTSRYQQVYDASEFSSIANGGGWITGIAFRFTDLTSQRPLPDFQIDLSTTRKSVDGLSTVFSANVGVDDRIVVDRGPLYLHYVYEGAPDRFPVLVDLTTPFFYNPSLGNLLLDVRGYHGTIGGQGSFTMDAVNTLGDSVSVVYAVGAIGSAGTGVDSASGMLTTAGITTAFIVTPVPEPGILGLACCFGGLWIIYRLLSRFSSRRAA